MDRLTRIRKMLTLSARVTARHPHLLAYMAAALLSISILFGAALAPVARSAWRAARNASSEDGAAVQILAPYARVTTTTATKVRVLPRWSVVLPVAFTVYFASTFLALFFNAALLLSARDALNGRPTSFRAGLEAAWERRRDLFWWALFSATVATLIDAARQKADGFLARRLLGGLSLAWKLATFLAVPVLVVEGGDPKTVVLRSAELFKRTWGESLAGELGLEVLETLAIGFGAAAGLFVGYEWLMRALDLASLGMSAGWPIPVCVAALALVAAATTTAVVFLKLVASVFTMSAYLFATEGVVPDEYRGEDDGWFVAARPG